MAKEGPGGSTDQWALAIKGASANARAGSKAGLKKTKNRKTQPDYLCLEIHWLLILKLNRKTRFLFPTLNTAFDIHPPPNISYPTCILPKAIQWKV